MPVSVKSITLWRKETDNTPGALAATLEPLAAAGTDLQIVMGYRFPGEHAKAAIELFPVANKKAAAAAQAAGLSPAGIPTLLIAGDNKPGFGHAMAAAIAGAGINMAFLSAQVMGKKFSAIAGFESEADAKKAAALIKKVKVKAVGAPARKK